MPRRGALLYALIVLLAGASLIREAAVGRLARLDETWAGLLGRRSVPGDTLTPLTLVEINDDTVAKHAWPWGPDDFALFFHAALPFGPSVVALEPVMEFESGSGEGRERQPMFEKMLHDHVLRAPKLILGARLGSAQDSDVVPELRPMPVLRKIKGNLGGLPEFVDVEAWAAETYRLTTQPGWTNVPDGIGPLGRCPLVLRYRGQLVPSLVLQLAMHLERVTLDEVEVVLGSHVALGPHRRIPIDNTGRMPVNLGARYGRVTFDDLLLTREQLDRKEAPAKPPELFQGRPILLARTDAGSQKLPVPGGGKIAAGELFATALATVASNAYPHRIGEWFDWTLVGVVAICALWLRKWRPLFALIVVPALIGCYAAAAWSLARTDLLIMPTVLPVGLGVWVLLLRAAARKIEKVIAF